MLGCIYKWMGLEVLKSLRFLASLPLANTAQMEGRAIRVANNHIISHPFRVYPVPKAKQGDWVMKMAIRAAIVSWRCKDRSDISLCHKDGKERSHIFSVLFSFISTLHDLLFKSLLTPLQSDRSTV